MNLDQMCLPPCHLSCQFHVETDSNGIDHLSCQMYQRSADMFLGEPWNIFSYSVLTYILAKKHNMKPKKLSICIGDAHIYADHIEQVKSQLSRQSLMLPILEIDDSVTNKSWEDIVIGDFNLIGYQHHQPISGKMSV